MKGVLERGFASSRLWYKADECPVAVNRRPGVGSLTRELVNTLLWVCGAGLRWFLAIAAGNRFRERPNASSSNHRPGTSSKAAGVATRLLPVIGYTS